MFDLSNKCFKTKSDFESEQLLRIAVAQGYSLPKGLKSLIINRLFKFIGFPYRAVSIPENDNIDEVINYADVFGNQDEELSEITKRAAQFCRAHGYSVLRIYADENEEDYSSSAYARAGDGAQIKSTAKIRKPRKVTIEEIEKRFGCPIEIIA